MGNDLVWGNGPKPSNVMLIGEAPGANEQEQLKPFVGKAGQILNDALAQAHMPRCSVYVTNVYKHRPPNNRKPLKDEVREHLPLLVEEFKTVNPKYALLLGGTALETFTGNAKISNARGKRVFLLDNTFSYIYFYATYHPAATIYSKVTKSVFYSDIETFAKIARGEYTFPN